MNPLAIPLIVDDIAAHLSLSDLAKCSLVCKSWHEAFARSLWDTIHLDHSFCAYMYGVSEYSGEWLEPVEPLPLSSTVCEKQVSVEQQTPRKPTNLARVTKALVHLKRIMDRRAKNGKTKAVKTSISNTDLSSSNIETFCDADNPFSSLQPLAEAFRTGIMSNGRHIRHIRTTVPDQLPILLHHTPHLSSLVILMENDSEWSAISSLANNSIIQLSSLEIVTRTLPRNWWEMIATFEHLTHLRLVNQYGPFNLEDLIHSVRRCRQLEDLRLVGSIRTNNVEQSKSAESLTPSRCFTESLLKQIEPLTSLSVLDLRFKDTDSLQDDFFLPFLKLAPNVKQLYPPQLSRTQAKSFVSAVQEYCRQIESLDLTSMVYLTDSDLAAVVKACTQESLRELLLNGSAIGQETMAAIVEHHAGSMEKLSIEQSLTPIPSASIQAVLANCTRLKEFKAGHQRWKGHVRLDAMDIIQAKWACQQHLETLAVCIVGCSTEALQNAVFEQLAQLTQLKNLDLSEMYNETQVDADKRGGSLVWAVGSGMDKLASLKRIEYFWILSGHFNLGEREKEWIYQHWPNLHKSAGVW